MASNEFSFGNFFHVKVFLLFFLLEDQKAKGQSGGSIEKRSKNHTLYHVCRYVYTITISNVNIALRLKDLMFSHQSWIDISRKECRHE